MIFFNGADNPNAIAFNMTELDNVYFNNTLVWQKTGAQNTDEYGTFDIPIQNAEDFGIDTGASSGTTPEVKYAINGTATLYRSSGSNDYFNNASFQTFAMYRYPGTSGDVMDEGIIYDCTATIQMSWPRNKALGIPDDPSDYLYCRADDGYMTSFSNLPSGTEFYEAQEMRTTVTMYADLVPSSIYDPSRWVTRVYDAEVGVLAGQKYVRFKLYGDEYNVYTATTGLIYQNSAELWLKFTS